MISPFKNLNIAYWACIVLDISIALVFWLGYQANPIFVLMFAVIWFVFIRMVFTSRSVKKINRFVAEHTQKCEIRPCIELYEKLLKITKGSKEYIYINLSTLYLACGEFEKMNQALDAVGETFKKDPRGISTACYYYNNRAFGHLMNNELDAAEENLRKMKGYLDLSSDQSTGRGGALYQAKLDLLSVLRGTCEDCELDLREKLIDQTDSSGRLLYGYILCTYLIGRGESEKAKRYLPPMVEEGGDTFYADWARKTLAKI